MVEKTIQSIPIMPFALMLACISAVIGFFLGLIYAIIFGAVFTSIPIPTSTPTVPGINLNWLGVILGVGAIIVVPIIMFIAGFIQGVIVAAVYNFLAPRIGGIKLRFKEENRPPLT